MITQIENLPETMVGFKASGDITEKDFTNVVMPKVAEQIQKTGKLNYMLVLETPISHFTAGAWFKDAIMGIKHLSKWNRAAIVSDVEGIRKFTDMFSIIMHGEFKGFDHNHLQDAIDWTSGKSEY
ncbi:MAG: STAS/SEC14 domain-containing protein [Bacteroidetes bacterium]|nr:STAS/SEC14 domain-containing protein [Bacteroidota bacterium]